MKKSFNVLSLGILLLTMSPKSWAGTGCLELLKEKNVDVQEQIRKYRKNNMILSMGGDAAGVAFGAIAGSIPVGLVIGGAWVAYSQISGKVTENRILGTADLISISHKVKNSEKFTPEDEKARSTFSKVKSFIEAERKLTVSDNELAELIIAESSKSIEDNIFCGKDKKDNILLSVLNKDVKTKLAYSLRFEDISKAEDDAINDRRLGITETPESQDDSDRMIIDEVEENGWPITKKQVLTSEQ